MYSQAKHHDSWPIEELDSQSISPYWFPFNIGSSANGVNAHWDLHYNIVDLDIRKEYYPNCYIRIEPLIGARSAFMEISICKDLFSL